MAASGTAAALAACGDGTVSGVANMAPIGGGGGGGGGSNKITVVVGSHAALATNGTFVVIQNAYAVKRTGPTSFDALYMACTHQGCLCSLIDNAFECPCHGSTFDNDGRVTRTPATTNLAKLPTSYDAGTDVLTIN